MPAILDIKDVLQFAVRIEENGENFYRSVARTITDEEVAKLFNFLAEEEVRHRKIFAEMLEKTGKHEVAETYPGEYFQYLKAYVENLIFSSTMEKQLKNRKGVRKIMDFAIGRELDSITYYLETKSLVPGIQHGILEKIIEEERSHFVRLSIMKEKMEK